MAVITVNEQEAALACSEQLRSHEVLSQGFQLRSAYGSEASCFMTLSVGIKKTSFSEPSSELQNTILWLSSFRAAKSSLDFCLQAVAWHIPDDYFWRR